MKCVQTRPSAWRSIALFVLTASTASVHAGSNDGHAPHPLHGIGTGAAVRAPQADTIFLDGFEWPNAGTTGAPRGLALTNQSAPMNTGLVIAVDNTVVDAINLSGWIDVQANNVVIQNSIITSNNWWGIKYESGYTGLKVVRNTITSVAGLGPDNGGYDYGVSPLGNGSMEVAYNDISGFKDAVDVATGNVHDNYMHDLSQFTGAHTQDVYVWCGGSGVTLLHNTMLNQTAQVYSTAALYVAPDCGSQNNVTVQNNWLAGGSLVLYGGGSTATDIRVLDNAFSTAIWSPDGGFNGTVGYWSGGNSGNVWSGNFWGDGPNVGQPVTP
ncbi:hypothetical protein [Dokdonella soli]